MSRTTGSATSLSTGFSRVGPLGRLERWLGAMPHPSVVVEISPAHVAAARFSATGTRLESYAIESVADGAILPSPVEVNIAKPDAVRSALRRVFSRVPPGRQGLALLVPDAVVRVFILPFENLPRRADEALPLLRWRLKKSVPFDVGETIVSWMRQTGRDGNLEVVTAVARQRIMREYEEAIEALGATAGVALSSTLGSLPLLEERGATLLVRMSARTLTTVVVEGSNLCVYRSTEMASDAGLLEPQAMLDEIFPAVAYFQDTWGSTIDRVRVAGFGARGEIFHRALAEELKVSVGSLAETDSSLELSPSTRDLLRQELDPLVGWALNGGA